MNTMLLSLNLKSKKEALALRVRVNTLDVASLQRRDATIAQIYNVAWFISIFRNSVLRLWFKGAYSCPSAIQFFSMAFSKVVKLRDWQWVRNESRPRGGCWEYTYNIMCVEKCARPRTHRSARAQSQAFIDARAIKNNKKLKTVVMCVAIIIDLHRHEGSQPELLDIFSCATVLASKQSFISVSYSAKGRGTCALIFY